MRIIVLVAAVVVVGALTISSADGVKPGKHTPQARALIFGDFRTEGGVTRPRTINGLIDGAMFDEGRMTEVALNPALPADTFSPAR